MHDAASLAIIVGVYFCGIGIGWGILVDPRRPVTYWIGAVSVGLTGFLIAGLAADAGPVIPVLVICFSLTALVRERRSARQAEQIQDENTEKPPHPR